MVRRVEEGRSRCSLALPPGLRFRLASVVSIPDQLLGGRLREGRIIDMVVQLHQLHAPQCRRTPSTTVPGVGVVERLPVAVDGGHAGNGSRIAAGPSRRPAYGQSLPPIRVLLRRRPHQRHRRIVLVELAAPESLGTVSGRPEVDHVRAPTDTTGHARRPPPSNARPGGKHSSDQLVRQFGGRDVQNPAINPSAINDSIACPPLPVA